MKMRSIRFSDQVSEETQFSLGDYDVSVKGQADYRINSLPRLKRHQSASSSMRTSSSTYGSLQRRPGSALARSHALDSSEVVEEYQPRTKASRVRSNLGHKLSHSRPPLSTMRTSSLDESHSDIGFYMQPRPVSRAALGRSGHSRTRTSSVDVSGERNSYLFQPNSSIINDTVDSYQPNHYSNGQNGSIDDSSLHLRYYQGSSRMAHPPKIRRQRSLNIEYPDEYDYQNVYDDNLATDQMTYSNTDYQIDPVSRLEIPNWARRQPESILKNGHSETNGSTPRSGLNADQGQEGSVAGSSYRSSSDGFERFYPTKKSSVCSSRGYSKSSEDSYNNESTSLLNRVDSDIANTNNDCNNSNESGVLRPLRSQPVPKSNSYGRLQAQANGSAMLSLCSNKADDFEVYHKLSLSNNKPPSVIANGTTSNGRGKREDEGEYPTISRAPSSGSQIIAKPNRPCCGGCCGTWCSRSSAHAVNPGNPHQNGVPICLLFIMFLVVSVVVVAGIMFYLKSESNVGCEDSMCAFGGVCIAPEGEGGVARCHCEDTCPYIFDPVCGSDGSTYDNECRLKLASCRKRKLIKQLHSGECGSRDPCSKLTCPRYSSCAPSYDGATASCQCPQTCSNPINEDSVVCGSNGQDYLSRCHLERFACENRQAHLEVRYEGSRCNPCQNFPCDSSHGECHLEMNSRKPTCRCSAECPDSLSPVCASNGKTYRNECFVKLESCRKNILLHTVYSGNCTSGLNQCHLLNCSYGQECLMDKLGIAECVCPKTCEAIVRPVCATDGRTYDNICEMKRSSCIQRANIAAKYIGVCDSNGPCTKRSCNHHSLCVESGDLAFCECPECSLEFSPVCGTDGHTYDNSCLLKRTACLKEEDIQVAEIGACSVCANMTCDFYAHCETDIDNKPICVCPKSCNTDANQLVCGTDGQTYDSECHLQMSACQKKQYIVVSNQGNCDFCQDIKCKHGAHCRQGSCVCPTECPKETYEPLCASDLNTYSNECEMLKASCENSQTIKFLYNGPCAKPTEQACGCSPFGSVRDDCEQMSGRCVCKPGILGPKCDLCPDGSPITHTGCKGLNIHVSDSDVIQCGNHTCLYGARCDTVYRRCSCDHLSCTIRTNLQPVCGSDGNTYSSECQMKEEQCRHQRSVIVTAYEPCREGKPTYTFFEGGHTEASYNDFYSDDPSNSLKSTRHADGDNHFAFYSNNGFMTPVTPESTITVFGLIGDFCITDLDCQVPNSICSFRTKRCVCSKGFEKLSSSNNKECVPSDNPDYFDGVVPTGDDLNEGDLKGMRGPCSAKPCEGGGTCEEHDGIFTCFCTSDRTGNRCERTLDVGGIQIASFNGVDSFVELMPLENVDHKLSVDIEFKTLSPHGILFYAQQNQNADGDFISLAIVNGYIEFRFDLGTGPSLIRSLREIKIGQWHRVQARRWHKDGILKVDQEDDVVGQSQGSLRSLEIGEPTYVGGIPQTQSQNMSKVMTNLGMASLRGLNGCINRFKVGQREIKIQAASEPFSLRRVGIVECRNDNDVSPNDVSPIEMPSVEVSPCRKSPCLNRGVCRDVTNSGFVCDCKLGFAGDRCQEIKTVSPTASVLPPQVPSRRPTQDFFVPAFNNNNQRTSNSLETSYVELPTLRHVGKAFHIEVWFLSKDLDGIILYNGQMSSGQGDFLSINLVQGHLQFRYDLGSGLANLTTREKIELGQWHLVKITRNGLKGTLQLNEGQVVKGSSAGSLSELNLEMPLYLGGFKHLHSLSKDSGIKKGLNGAIQRLIVNGNAYDDLLGKARNSRGVSRYSGPPCDDPDEIDVLAGLAKSSRRQEKRCHNGGQCIPFFRSYVCKCPTDYTGKKCEKKMTEANERNPIKFEGNTFLKFVNTVTKSPSIETPDFDDIFEDFDDDDRLLIGADEEQEEDLDEQDTIDEGEEYLRDIGLIGRRRSEKRNKFTILLRTKSKNGLIIWTNQGSNVLGGDYLALSLSDGQPELSFSLGSSSKFQSGQMEKPFKIVAKNRVDDGRWHRIQVLRKRKIGILQVDKNRPVRAKANKGSGVLNTDGYIWIGGKPSLPSGLPSHYYRGFSGCVKRVKVFRKKLDLLRHQGDNSNLQFCESPSQAANSFEIW